MSKEEHSSFHENTGSTPAHITKRVLFFVRCELVQRVPAKGTGPETTYTVPECTPYFPLWWARYIAAFYSHFSFRSQFFRHTTLHHSSFPSLRAGTLRLAGSFNFKADDYYRLVCPAGQCNRSNNLGTPPCCNRCSPVASSQARLCAYYVFLTCR